MKQTIFLIFFGALMFSSGIVFAREYTKIVLYGTAEGWYKVITEQNLNKVTISNIDVS